MRDSPLAPLRLRHAGVAAGRVRGRGTCSRRSSCSRRSCSCAASRAAASRDLVRSVEAHGATLSFVTTLQPGRGGRGRRPHGRRQHAALRVRAAAVRGAHARGARSARCGARLLIGYLAMLPFIAWGVLADFLKNVAITASPLVASQAGFGAVAARYDRVCLSVRIADPARRRARGGVGAHAPRVPGRSMRSRERAADARRNGHSFRGAFVQHIIVGSSLPSRMSALAFVSKLVAYSPGDAWTVWLASGVVLGSPAGGAPRALARRARRRLHRRRADSRSRSAVDALDALGYGAIEVLTAGGAALIVSRLTALAAALDARAGARGADRRRRAAARAGRAACSPRRGTSPPAAAHAGRDVPRLGRSPISSARCWWRP